MRLDSLTVIHLPKKRVCSSLDLPALEGAFFLDSCQRRLWVFNSEVRPVSSVFKFPSDAAEVYSGSDAYRFLLQVSTGLKSEIQGETNIFGQIKESWKQFLKTGSACACHLDSWMQRLFEDTKEIRSRHLRGFGGDAYGSLVRKFLRDQNFVRAEGRVLEGPILVVGAGQIAQSVAPWLTGCELWLLNRNRQRCLELEQELTLRPGARVRMINPEDEADAWKNARHAVVCIPLDSEGDQVRVENWKNGRNGDARAIVHLGVTGNDRGKWTGLPEFFALDDLFVYQKAQGDVRSVALVQAAKACDERAKLRGLGPSVTLPHGWEDLAIFV